MGRSSRSMGLVCREGLDARIRGRPMSLSEQQIRAWAESAESRFDLWAGFIRLADVRRMLEVGVYAGELAAFILGHADGIERYYMLDPWRHLERWNKPANRDDPEFERLLAETMAKTDFASGRREILRGTTTEVIDRIPDGSLDLAYIDGDHTLKGISIDLIRVYPKVREGGWIAGDDFSSTVWQHDPSFEPTLVFPFAVYFAEAVGAPIWALPHGQFLIRKDPGSGFAFNDLVGKYADCSLGAQVRPQGRFAPLRYPSGPHPLGAAPAVSGLDQLSRARAASNRARVSSTRGLSQANSPGTS